MGTRPMRLTLPHNASWHQSHSLCAWQRAGRDITGRVTNPLSGTERTRHRRLREQGRTDRGDLFAVLAAGLVAHLGLVSDGCAHRRPPWRGSISCSTLRTLRHHISP